ncbi:MAG: hypothetical protein IPK30_12360 [Cellvibrionales bacterium]|nr:hypothetical protein [Cellvibrionales bacterium]
MNTKKNENFNGKTWCSHTGKAKCHEAPFTAIGDGKKADAVVIASDIGKGEVDLAQPPPPVKM